MRKTVTVVILCALCFCLCACDPAPFSFDYDELFDSVVSVELINYFNADQKHFVSWVPNHFSELVSFEIENMQILEILDEDDIPGLLKELSEVSFLYKYYAYDSPRDICIKLNFANGDFEIIWCNYPSFSGYVGRYGANGNVVDFSGNFNNSADYQALINNYFKTQI